MMRVVPAADLPMPSGWCVTCPCCGAELEYEPEEDDAGHFTPRDQWPECEACNIVVEPPTVAIVANPAGPFWQRRG